MLCLNRNTSTKTEEQGRLRGNAEIPQTCAMQAVQESSEAKLARLRELAECEMRRRLPGENGAPSAKRQKTAAGSSSGGGGSDGGRFDYGAVRELASGITGFLVTCSLQR